MATLTMVLNIYLEFSPSNSPLKIVDIQTIIDGFCDFVFFKPCLAIAELQMLFNGVT